MHMPVNPYQPVIPLPEESAGLPIDSQGNAVTGGTPVVPLPDEGAGLPIDDIGNAITGGTPVIPLPDEDDGLPIDDQGNAITGPTYPGWPSRARIRLLHGAYGYPSLRVRVGRAQVANWLGYASLSTYVRIPAGYQTVTVSGMDGYIYLQKTIPFQYGAAGTVAIINRAGGMDLLQIPDACCSPNRGYGNFRVSNLVYNSAPLDVLLVDGRVIYADVVFKETTSFKRIRPGEYQFFFAQTDLASMPSWMDIETLDSAFLGETPQAETVASVYLNVLRNTAYTVFLLRSGAGSGAVQTLVAAD